MTQISGTGAHLDDTQLRAWTALLDTSRILDSELETALLTHHAMTHREYEVLVRVDGHGGRMRMSLLARQIEASPALISQTVAKLESRNWVQREPSHEDKRGVDAVLTGDGLVALERAAQPHAELIARLLLDPLGGSLEQVAAALSGVANHLRNHRAGSTCDDSTCPLNASNSA